jgi:hypothetical protein
VARFCYFTFPFKNQVRSIDFITEVFWSVIPGFIIQFIFIGIVGLFTNYHVNFSYIGSLIIGFKEDDTQRLAAVMQNIYENLFNIIAYNVCIILFSAALGYVLMRAVRIFGLDTRFDFFTFNNK